MKKKILSFIIYYSGILWLKLLWMRIFGNKKLRILCYHRVCDVDENFMLDEGVVSASPTEFERQMKFVSKYFNVITFRALEEYRDNGKFPENSLIITFDDGYKDNYTNAYPILKKYGLPATIFLTTGYIGTNRLFWWDKVAYIIKKTEEEELEISLNRDIYRFDLSSLDLKREAIPKVIKLLKGLRNDTREVAFQEMGKKLKVTIDSSMAESVLLTWEEVKEMSHNGIEFGAHTVNHPIFSWILHSEMEKEVISSKKDIEMNISLPSVAFVYPDIYYDELSKEAVKKAGFQFACTLKQGINEDYNDPYELKRITISPTINKSLFKVYLLFPSLMLKTFCIDRNS